MKTSLDIFRDNRGVALISVAWVLVILSVIAVQVCRSAKMDMGTLSYFEEEVKAESYARSALLEATALAVNNNAETAAGGEVFRDDEGNRTGSYSYEIVDESGRLYLNSASVNEIRILLNLLKTGGAETLSARIYNAAEQYPGSGQVFTSELLDVEGIDEQLLFGEDIDDDLILDHRENDGADSEPPDNADGKLDFGVRRYIRVSCPGKVNINRAPREVLMSILDTPPEAVDSIMEEVEKSGRSATLASMKKSPRISEVIKEAINNKVTDRSECFRVRAEGVSGTAVRVINAYFYADPEGGTRLLHWWES